MTNKSSPKVSIVVPVLNGERYLEQCLTSLCEQTLASEIEIIIVDDGSTDESTIIARKFVSTFPFCSLIELEYNVGLPKALNIGFAKAAGAIYSWISCDNFVAEDYFEKMLALLILRDVHILYTDYDVVSHEGIKIEEKKVDDLFWLPRENCFGASFLYRKEIHDFLEGFNEEYFLFEDYDFIFRAFLSGFTYQIEANQGYSFRSHPMQLTQTRRLPKKYFKFRSLMLKLSTHLSRRDKVECLVSVFKFCVIRQEMSWAFIFASRAFFTNPILFFKCISGEIIRLSRKANR